MNPPPAVAQTARTYPVPAYPDIHLPPTLDWYRQAANWLVGLATGVLAVGLSSADTIPFETPGQRWLVGLCIGCFLVTVGGGISFYFWITKFTNCLEQREKFAHWYSTETNPATKQAHLNSHMAADQGATLASHRYTFFYTTMMLSFLAAVVCMIAVLVSLLRKEPATKPTKLTVFTAHNRTFLLDEQSGKTWLLTSDSLHRLSWKSVTIRR